MMLDTVHHQGLRLALGAFRTSPVESLYVEAEEPSLYLRRETLALQYAIRLAANPSNPTFKVTFPPHISQDIIDLYDNKQNAIRSFGLRIAPLLTSANINKEQIAIDFPSLAMTSVTEAYLSKNRYGEDSDKIPIHKGY